MGYDEPGAHRRRAVQRPQTQPGTEPAGTERPGGGATSFRSPPSRDSTPVLDSPSALDDLADDPAHGEPGRDRIVVHVVWEVVLLVAVVLLAYLLHRGSPESLRGEALRSLLLAAVALGLVVVAAGLSLRAAAPNLAVGPVALAAALHFAEQGDRGILPALGPVVLVAAAGGLLLALVVVVLQVPAWAASLAAAAAVIVFIERRTGPVLTQADYDPVGNAFHLFAGFAAASVISGLLGVIKTVRRLVGRFRPVADPARRRGGLAAAVTTVAIVVSTVLAAFAGVLVAAEEAVPLRVNSGLDWTVLAVGVAMLGGTSAYGRRGGIFGTLLAVMLVTLVLGHVRAEGWSVGRYAVGGAALAVGLGVTRLVEYYGRPRPVSRARPTTGGGPEPARVLDGATSGGWTVPRTSSAESWPTALPTQPTESQADPWGVERWENGPERWHRDDR